MNRSLSILFWVFFGTCLISEPLVWAQQAQEQSCDFKTVSGRVIALDWVASLLVIDIGGDDLSLVVSSDVEIKKGTSKIGLSSINQSDNVIVKYYDCGFAGLKAVQVTVKTSGY